MCSVVVVLDCLARDSSVKDSKGRPPNTRAGIGEFYLFGAGPPSASASHASLPPTRQPRSSGDSRGLVWWQLVAAGSRSLGRPTKIGSETCMCLRERAIFCAQPKRAPYSIHPPTTSRHITLPLGRARISVAWYCSLAVVRAML